MKSNLSCLQSEKDGLPGRFPRLLSTLNSNILKLLTYSKVLPSAYGSDVFLTKSLDTPSNPSDRVRPGEYSHGALVVLCADRWSLWLL